MIPFLYNFSIKSGKKAKSKKWIRKWWLNKNSSIDFSQFIANQCHKQEKMLITTKSNKKEFPIICSVFFKKKRAAALKVSKSFKKVKKLYVFYFL